MSDAARAWVIVLMVCGLALALDRIADAWDLPLARALTVLWPAIVVVALLLAVAETFGWRRGW